MRKMRQRERSRRWFMGLFMLGMAGLCPACSSPGGEGCGGIEDLVSCVTITNIEAESQNIDAFVDPDCDNDPTTSDPEPLLDDNVTINFSNDQFPGASGGLPVQIRQVSIFYSLNSVPCPGTACPLLSAPPQDISLTIPAGETASISLSLVPIQTKLDYVANGGDPNVAPSYTAHYRFTAQTQSFEDSFTIEGSVSFTIGNFSTCQ